MMWQKGTWSHSLLVRQSDVNNYNKVKWHWFSKLLGNINQQRDGGTRAQYKKKSTSTDDTFYDRV